MRPQWVEARLAALVKRRSEIGLLALRLLDEGHGLAAPVPTQDTWFKSVNGNLDVSFLDGLSADFSMKTFNGGLYTDFDVQPLPGTVSATGERRNGRFIYRANEFTRVRVGRGGPQIAFETLNGNVRARRSGGRAQ